MLQHYANNSIFQEVRNEDTYFSDSNEQIYLDMCNSKGYTNKLEKLKQNDSDLVLKLELKDAVVDKFCLRLWSYLQGEYLYVLGSNGLSMKYK